MPDTTVTWLGHASFRVDTSGGKRVYVDPFLTHGPTCPDGERTPERADAIAITHGHGDHIGDAVAIAGKHGSTVVGNVELVTWLGAQGVAEGQLVGMNKGGTVDAGGVKLTMTNAYHSSGLPDGSYGGEAGGFVLEAEDGKRVYFAGDTCVFGDMQLIGRIYQPDLVVLPIGDHYTMGPREAAVALELLGAKRCLPCHWGTFPVLTGRPEQLQELAPGVEVLRVQPGEAVAV